MNRTHRVLAYVDDVNIIGDDIRTIKGNADVFTKCLYGYRFSSKHREN